MKNESYSKIVRKGARQLIVILIILYAVLAIFGVSKITILLVLVGISIPIVGFIMTKVAFYVMGLLKAVLKGWWKDE